MALLAFELRWAAVVARGFVPYDALGGSTAKADLPALLQADCAAAPWQANLLLRFALWLTWLAPLWLAGRLRTFGGLDEGEREALLERLLASKFRLVRLPMFYLKLMAVALLLGNRESLARIGAYTMQAEKPVLLARGPR